MFDQLGNGGCLERDDALVNGTRALRVERDHKTAAFCTTSQVSERRIIRQ